MVNRLRRPTPLASQLRPKAQAIFGSGGVVAEEIISLGLARIDYSLRHHVKKYV